MVRALKTPVDNKSLIVADSDPYVREMVGRFLSEAGYIVSYATNGYEALDNARRSPPIAIFADIMLPRLDGLALCRLLKGDPDTKDIITVIVFSVLSAGEKARQAGADAFIRKPLEKKDVLKALESIISKEAEA